MKNGEEMFTEFTAFLRERVSIEEESMKFLNRSTAKVVFTFQPSTFTMTF